MLRTSRPRRRRTAASKRPIAAPTSPAGRSVSRTALSSSTLHGRRSFSAALDMADQLWGKSTLIPSIGSRIRKIVNASRTRTKSSSGPKPASPSSNGSGSVEGQRDFLPTLRLAMTLLECSPPLQSIDYHLGRRFPCAILQDRVVQGCRRTVHQVRSPRPRPSAALSDPHHSSRRKHTPPNGHRSSAR